MPRTCTICARADVEAINSARLSGTPFRHIASQFGTSTGALQRHYAEHLPVTLTRAAEVRAIASADRLLAELDALYCEARELREQAKADGNAAGVLLTIAESRRLLETLHSVLQAMQNGASAAVPLEQAAERRAILETLRPYPGALLAVISTLENGHERGI